MMNMCWPFSHKILLKSIQTISNCPKLLKSCDEYMYIGNDKGYENVVARKAIRLKRFEIKTCIAKACANAVGDIGILNVFMLCSLQLIVL